MNKRTTLVMTGAVVAGFLIILMMNIASFFGIESATYLSPNNIRGSAVEHSGLLYTLNYEQQNRLLGIINRSIPLTKDEAAERKADGAANQEVQKVVIYRFNVPDLELVPVGYVKPRAGSAAPKEEILAMVYSVPGEVTPVGFLEESVPGELKQFFSETYDH
jgi:hypothetical protein